VNYHVSLVKVGFIIDQGNLGKGEISVSSAANWKYENFVILVRFG